MKVRVLYDFVSQGVNELDVSEGEVLTITNQDIGAGWWQAVNSSGKTGLVPCAFVEVIHLPEPSAPPPPLPSIEYGREPDAAEDWDEEWDSDDEDSGTLARGISEQHKQSSDTYSNSHFGSKPSITTHPEYARGTSIRRCFNRAFVRTGGEDYLINHDPPPFPHTEVVIEYVDQSFRWRTPSQTLTCQISSFRKDSKMKGIKSFIAYQLTTSISNHQVSRRYKHFDWLHSRLTSKFPCVCIPPLPEKAITGRYDEEFVDERRKQLQLWLTRMCNHPVVSQSSVFIHFLTCVDMKKWKAGKREAETDKLQGGRFFFAVESKHPRCLEDYTLEKAEAFEKFIMELDRTTRVFYDTLNDFHRKLLINTTKEFSLLSTMIRNMAKSIEADVHTKSLNGKLTAALTATSMNYKSISVMHSIQSEATINMLDCFRTFSRLLPTTSNLVNLSKSACLTVEDVGRANSENKISATDTMNIQAGSLVITRASQAECNLIMDSIREEWMIKFKEYLEEQGRFYRKIADHFDNTAKLFE